jgi:maltooligosyltrehalose trehalohydrolase
VTRWAPVGALASQDDAVRFIVWAPRCDRVGVRTWRADAAADVREVAMERDANGYHVALVDGVGHGDRYVFAVGDEALPDPASRWQPEGVHGPSAFVAPSSLSGFETAPGLPLERFVLYELHVGTFSPEGTFDGAVAHLDRLVDLGITAVELMPVAQFPGARNWGYDGVFPYAAQDTYGGPEGLRRLVAACHERGLAAVLDVVYNHLGPEGNVLERFGPYFTDAYATPWGPAMNVADAGSDEVRRFLVGNALWWLGDMGFDALRLDAIHGIVDPTAVPFLQELAEAVDALEVRTGRRLHLIAESALNDVRVVRPREVGGLGLDAQWNDDFHHALRVALTGEDAGYYADYGALEDLATAYREAFVLRDRYSRSRGRRHGNDARGEPGRRFVVFAQNHDQVGNRKDGDRLTAVEDVASLTLAAAAVAFSPFLPLLFMGEEYAEPAPFPYFIDHQDPSLVEAVRQGRREEFAGFAWEGEVPDPAAEATFASARLDHALRERSPHAEVLACYRELLRLRRDVPALARLAPVETRTEVDEAACALVTLRPHEDGDAMVVLAFGEEPMEIGRAFPGRWHRIFASTEERFGGPGTDAPGTVLISPAGMPLRVPARAAFLYLREAA